ncbi:MAG TPA: hypothetical protein VE046_05285 [Steroidobacteraceae bacterium]|nr:hypothetical protein [Steroidobacteraceae bacterium]
MNGRTLSLLTVCVVVVSGVPERAWSSVDNDSYTDLYPALEALYKDANRRGVAFSTELEAIGKRGGSITHDNPFLPGKLMTADGIRAARDLMDKANATLVERAQAIDRFLTGMATMIASAKIHQSDRAIAKADFEKNREQFRQLETLAQNAHRESGGYAARLLDLCESQLGRMSLDAQGYLSFSDPAADAQFRQVMSTWQKLGPVESDTSNEVRNFVVSVRQTWLVARELD